MNAYTHMHAWACERAYTFVLAGCSCSHSSPFPHPFHASFSVVGSLCCVIFVVGFLYSHMYIHTDTNKIVISMRPIPPTAQMFPTHTSKILCRYLCMYGCMCVYVCVCNHNSRCGVINQRKMQYKRIARSLRQSSPKVQKYIWYAYTYVCTYIWSICRPHSHARAYVCKCMHRVYLKCRMSTWMHLSLCVLVCLPFPTISRSGANSKNNNNYTVVLCSQWLFVRSKHYDKK